MTLHFLLALLLAFVRWLRLFRVRALKRSFHVLLKSVKGLFNLRGIFEHRFNLLRQRSGNGRIFEQVPEVFTNVRYSSPMTVNIEVVHNTESASERARRQGPTVPGLLRKAPTYNLKRAA